MIMIIFSQLWFFKVVFIGFIFKVVLQQSLVFFAGE